MYLQFPLSNYAHDYRNTMHDRKIYEMSKDRVACDFSAFNCAAVMSFQNLIRFYVSIRLEFDEEIQE